MNNDETRLYWENKYTIAEENSKKAKQNFSSILIEVAVQHPLINGIFPNKEFQARLDLGIELFNRLSKTNDVFIFVPGSRHTFEGIDDKISLSEAGKNYLLSKGIPENKIYGEDKILEFKNDEGVYNSADECYVASKIFFNYKFGTLICVCSPNQLLRKTLFYIEFGVIPQCYSVPTENMYHSPIGEVFDCIPSVLYDDHNWQDKNKETYNISRKFRKPIK